MTTTFDEMRSIADSVTSDLEPDALARAIWTLIAEPLDEETGNLIQAAGAERALALILDSDEAEHGGLALETIRDRSLPRANASSLHRVLHTSARFGVKLITPDHADWPVRLNDLGPRAPFALWVRGNSKLLQAESPIAVVGARAATGYGEHMTMEIAAGLVERDFTIVSGAAYGIDGMAHRAALAANGMTIAYLAGGVDRFYPSGHDALLTRIAEHGAVVSELPVMSAPTKWRFLARNRLIAASTRSTVVVEAGFRSGSLNTAGHAIALGRPVGAVPGPVTSAASAGCHRLLREFGATLITNSCEASQL
jgi:DNA processing protein